MSVTIENIEPVIVSQTLEEPFYFSQWEYQKRTICLVRVTTNTGIVGWGEGYGPFGVVKAAIEFFKPFILGMDALEHETVWNVMYRRSLDFARRGTFMAGLSAIDIALWDIKGKHFGLPIHSLLGGKKTDLIKPYATGLYFTGGQNVDKDVLLERLVKEAVQYKKEGFKALKMKVGLDLDRDEKHVKAVRRAIGPEMELMVDANHAYSLAEAVELSRRIECCNIGFFEEPVSPEYYSQYRELRTKTSIPIAGGECEYLTHGFKALLDAESVDFVQPDVAASGGITEMKRIANLANAYGVKMVPHSWGTGIAIHAAMHVIANMDPLPGRMFNSIPLIELDRTENALRDILVKPYIQQKDGYLNVPNKPGLGIEVDPTELQKYQI